MVPGSTEPREGSPRIGAAESGLTIMNLALKKFQPSEYESLAKSETRYFQKILTVLKN